MTKKAPALIDRLQAAEVYVTAVHDVEGAGLKDHVFEEEPLIDITARNPCKHRQMRLDVQLCVELDPACDGLMDWCRRPWEELQAEFDVGGIQGIDRSLKPLKKALFAVQYAARAINTSAKSW